MRAATLALAIFAAAGAQAEDRRVAVDPNASPWNAIAKVQTNIGERCSGVLIAPSVVLTAAHCLFNPRTRAMLEPLSLHVLFGYQRGGYRAHRLVARITFGSGIDGKLRHPQADDWARLYLAEPVPATPMPRFAGSVKPGMAVALAGYNQDRAHLLMADLGCQVLRVVPLPGGSCFLVHDCAATHGTSGAPLLVRRDEGWAVIGINVAAGRKANLALSAPVEN